MMDNSNSSSVAVERQGSFQQQLVLPYNDQAAAVDEAVQKALALVKLYSECDPSAVNKSNNDDADGSNNKNNNAWQNPDQIYQQLDQARNEISLAWKELDAAVAAANDNNNNNAKDNNSMTIMSHNKDQLRLAYMDMITDSFADVLENLRQNNTADDPLDVELLVDCLQSGLELFNMNNNGGSSNPLFGEADFSWNEDDDDDDDDDAAMLDEDEDGNTKLTPHESRRRELGFNLEESTA